MPEWNLWGWVATGFVFKGCTSALSHYQCIKALKKQKALNQPWPGLILSASTIHLAEAVLLLLTMALLCQHQQQIYLSNTVQSRKY